MAGPRPRRGSSALSTEPKKQSMTSTENVCRQSPAEAKITLFRSLFRGREDVYPPEEARGRQRTGRQLEVADHQALEARSATPSRSWRDVPDKVRLPPPPPFDSGASRLAHGALRGHPADESNGAPSDQSSGSKSRGTPCPWLRSLMVPSGHPVLFPRKPAALSPTPLRHHQYFLGSQ